MESQWRGFATAPSPYSCTSRSPVRWGAHGRLLCLLQTLAQSVRTYEHQRRNGKSPNRHPAWEPHGCDRWILFCFSLLHRVPVLSVKPARRRRVRRWAEFFSMRSRCVLFAGAGAKHLAVDGACTGVPPGHRLSAGRSLQLALERDDFGSRRFCLLVRCGRGPGDGGVAAPHRAGGTYVVLPHEGLCMGSRPSSQC